MTWIDAAGDDSEVVDVLGVIATNTQALSGAKGILSDLRVTPTGTVTVGGTLTGVTTVTTVTTCTTVTTVTGITNMGGLPLNTVVPNWTNQTATQAFVNNIARS